MENGKKTWYIPDGWIPAPKRNDEDKYEGHEALIILNCNECDVKVYMDVYFEDKAPIKDLELFVPAERVKCFRMDKPEEICGVDLGRLSQYSLRIRCEQNIVVQFGRMDVTQDNCAYIGLMGYSE